MVTGEELRERRLDAGLTQAELADLLGVAVRSIRNWEAHGVPDHRVALLDAKLPDEVPVIERAFARSLVGLESRSDHELVLEAIEALSFVHHAREREVSESSVERAMTGIVDLLDETGALDTLNADTRRSILTMMVGPVKLGAGRPGAPASATPARLRSSVSDLGFTIENDLPAAAQTRDVQAEHEGFENEG